MTIRSEIAAELCRALERLGAPSALLRIVGAYGDDLDDDEVLEQLRGFNDMEELEPGPIAGPCGAS